MNIILHCRTSCCWNKGWCPTCVETSTYAHQHTQVHACTHTYIHTYIHAYIQTYMHAHKHTSIHKYIHVYIIDTHILTHTLSCSYALVQIVLFFLPEQDMIMQSFEAPGLKDHISDS